MQPHRSDDGTDVKVRVDNKIPLWAVLSTLGAGCVFITGLLFTIVTTQNNTNQTMGRIGDDVKEIRSDVRRGNDATQIMTLKQAEQESTIKALDRRLTAQETRFETLRSK